MRCDDIEDMTLKCHVRRQDTLLFIKRKGHPGPWPLAPDPWPTILVSLLPIRCSEQAAAGSSRQQAEAATGSRQRQQQTAGSSNKQQAKVIKRMSSIFFQISWNMKMA